MRLKAAAALLLLGTLAPCPFFADVSAKGANLSEPPGAAEPAKAGDRARTAGGANAVRLQPGPSVAALPPGQFPPKGSGRRVDGELIEADYIHRAGVLREDRSGALMEFALLPFASPTYVNAEADLRDIPIGTHFAFQLCGEPRGGVVQSAAMEDDFTLAIRAGRRFRVLGVDLAAGKLRVAREAERGSTGLAGQEEIAANSATRVWIGARLGTLKDVAPGQVALVDFTGGSPGHPVRCADVWAGADTFSLATALQRKRHWAFIKARGVPAWVDRVDGEHMTVTLFSTEPDTLRAALMLEGGDPARWAKEHSRVAVEVANEHLRTYNAQVTNRGATVEQFEAAPTSGYGCSGARLVLRPDLMLEGFRKGRIVRIFGPNWPIDPMPFGEGLFAGGHDEEPADSKELQAADFPYRTDFGNENLPWYSLQPGKTPPDHSEHRVEGELIAVDATGRAGRFRTDRTGEIVEFTLPAVASVRFLNADAGLKDIPLGTRCHFFLYQDAHRAFTQAATVLDEFSSLASNTITYRVEAVRPVEGVLIVARHPAPVQVDYILEPRVAPDFGRLELEVDARTRVWKGNRQVTLADLAAGDELLVNLGARTATSQGRCTDIWAGAEARRNAARRGTRAGGAVAPRL